MLRLSCCLLAALTAWTPSLGAQGTLSRARAETVHHDAPAPAAAPASSSSDPGKSASGSGPGNTPSDPLDNSDENDLLGYLALGAAGVFVASSPFWAPSLLLDDDVRNPGYFPSYPYAAGKDGYQRLATACTDPHDAQKAQFGDPDFLKVWSVRLSAEDGDDFRGLNRVNGRLFVDTTWRVGVLANWNYLRENLAGGRSDEALLGDTNLTFRLAQSECVQMHTGLGCRMLSDSGDTRYGFNFFYGADVYPAKPLVLSASVDLGTLDSAFVVHGRGTVGVLYKGFEVFGGFDFLRIGSVNLQGPLVGLRLWF